MDTDTDVGIFFQDVLVEEELSFSGDGVVQDSII